MNCGSPAQQRRLSPEQRKVSQEIVIGFGKQVQSRTKGIIPTTYVVDMRHLSKAGTRLPYTENVSPTYGAVG